MLFLLRMAFWLSIVLVLLPSGGPKQDAHAPSNSQLSAGEAVTAAGATVSDIRQFCVRQPEACAVGTQAAIAFGERAQAGAKMLFQFFSEKMASQEKTAPQTTGSIAHGESAKSVSRASAGHSASAGRKPSQDTLTPRDTTAPWRGPQSPLQEAQSKPPA